MDNKCRKKQTKVVLVICTLLHGEQCSVITLHIFISLMLTHKGCFYYYFSKCQNKESILYISILQLNTNK